MQPFIRVSQLKQSFGAQEVLKGVSFDVDKGELLALIGGSGGDLLSGGSGTTRPCAAISRR